MSTEILTEAQIDLARKIAWLEATRAVERIFPDMTGFSELYEGYLSMETQAMLAEYELVKMDIFTQMRRLVEMSSGYHEKAKDVATNLANTYLTQMGAP